MVRDLSLLFRSVAVLTGILVSAGCSSGKRTDNAEKVIPVEVVTVSEDAQASSRDYVGVIEEESASALSFQVQGNVVEVTVGEGDRVKQGQLLAKLNDDNLQSTYNAAKASLKQAEDAMERLQKLYDNQSLPEMKYVEVRSKLEQARSMEEVARKNLNESHLVAPFDGVIGKRSVEVGENVMPGQSVFTLLKINRVKVKISVPENEISGIDGNCTATVSVGALGGKTFTGSVSEKGIVANPVSHTYDARMVLLNPSGELMPGMVCRVQVRDEISAPAIVLPNSAVQVSDRNERFVWCVKDGAAVKVPVVTGDLTGVGLVIENGLTGGEQVITGGYQKVSEGMKVQVR